MLLVQWKRPVHSAEDLGLESDMLNKMQGVRLSHEL